VDNFSIKIIDGWGTSCFGDHRISLRTGEKSRNLTLHAMDKPEHWDGDWITSSRGKFKVKKTMEGEEWLVVHRDKIGALGTAIIALSEAIAVELGLKPSEFIITRPQMYCRNTPKKVTALESSQFSPRIEEIGF